MADYKRCIFTFMDVLGFSRLVQAAKGPDSILELLNLLHTTAKPDNEVATLHEIDFVTFSD